MGNNEDAAWMDAAAADLGTRLAAIESDIPPAELAAWLLKIREGAIPVRFNPETNEMEVVQP